jgi:hypothetical protein
MDDKQLIYNVEYTDTYGGEANYSWVRRASFKASASLSDREIVRRAKKEIDLTGVRCKRNNFGEMIELRPYGSATVMFITYEEAFEIQPA